MKTRFIAFAAVLAITVFAGQSVAQKNSISTMDSSITGINPIVVPAGK